MPTPSTRPTSRRSRRPTSRSRGEYRSDFTVRDRTERTYLDFSGVISAADVYVNGKQVARAADVNGAYTQHELDVTSLVRSGTNTVAFRIRPNDPNKNLTTGLDRLAPAAARPEHGHRP
ncbi:glycosyl hydrolase 2 galactose-binding domain-containing protein [Streptomyces sp. L7]